MIDREMVIKGLEQAKDIIERWIPMFEQYNTPCVIDCAITMLKEQKAVEPFHRCINDFALIEDSHFDYCPYCGKPITWAKLEGR